MALNFTRIITTSSPEETQALGKRIGEWATPGTLLALTGDLGSGKTAFVQGLARGLNVPEAFYITSPTFTIVNEYPGRLPLYHADLYRIDDPDELDYIGLSELIEGNGVMAIEWAEKMDFTGIDRYLRIDFNMIDDTVRTLRIEGYGIDDFEVNRQPL